MWPSRNAEQWQRNATGIQVAGTDSANNTIIHNITYANEDSGLQFYAGAHDNLVLGNLSYGNGDHGIDLKLHLQAISLSATLCKAM